MRPVENHPIKMRQLHPSVTPPPWHLSGQAYAPGAIRAQVDRALPDPGDATGAPNPADLAAAIPGLVEATKILADRFDDLHAQLRAR
jgi:hypothetical protein